MQITFTEGHLKAFFEHFKKLNRKLQRLGGEHNVMVISEVSSETEIVEVDGENFEETRITVDIDEPAITSHGLKFLGTINRESTGSFTVFNVDGSHNLSEEEERCDHCHLQRHRKKYHFFEKDGEVLSIGSTCAKEYFGYDVEALLKAAAELYEAFEGQDERGTWVGESAPRVAPIVNFLAAVKLGTFDFTNWTSHRATEYDANAVPSATNVRMVMETTPGMCPEDRDAIIEARREVRENLSEYSEKIIAKWRDAEEDSDFTRSIKSQLFDEGGLRQWVSYRGLGIAAFAVFKALERDASDVVEFDLTQSEYIGAVKAKVDLEAKFLSFRTFETQYGFMGALTLVTQEGNVIETVTAAHRAEEMAGALSETEYRKISGKVKSHEESPYIKKGGLVKVTRLSYFKVG